MITSNDRAEYAERLANYILLLGLKFNECKTSYSHMGATITDSVLQAGLNYKTVVYPRIERILTEYRDFDSTTDFILLINILSLEELICFKNKRKLRCIWEISLLFQSCRIETEDQLAFWLSNDTNLQYLKAINGVGAKTIDYIKTLVGLNTIAVDRHLFNFLSCAGIAANSYSEARSIFCRTAELLDMSYLSLDKMIWSYMSEHSSKTH